jgi:primary-amine oxidase
MAFGTRRTFAAAILGLLCAAPGAATHPLDSLSPDEIRTVIAVLRGQGLADAATRFALIDLDEPDKAAVMAWQPGQPEFRKAFVTARRDRTVYEGVVDPAARTVESWHAVPGAQSGFLVEEWEAARRITLADAGWQAAMRRRGYPNFDGISCAPLSPGPAADRREAGKRLLRVACFDETGAETAWSRPIEGLIAVVDLDAGRVMRLIHTGPVPVPSDRSRLPETSPISTSPVPASSARHDFTIDGSGVTWGGWSFRFRLDRRAGLIVSLLRYADRMILYRGSLAEMFVPYMDADPAWSFRAFMDEGEWGLGLAASPLRPGIDCPADAVFLDAVLADDRGDPLVGKSVICMFERDTGAPLWRHFETASGAAAGQPATELVIRTIPSLGNYDYIIDWVLTPVGAIRIDVGATGIDAVKAVAAGKGEGELIASNRVGVDHDHFLSFRLDLDIDGPTNTLVRRRLMPDNAGHWHPADLPVTREGALGAGMQDGPEIWRVVDPTATNALGGHPAYELRLDHTATSLLPAGSPAQRRAAFSAAPLWVTAYDRTELYAAGAYLGNGAGLPAFAAKRRPVEGADIVLWPTLGFHHLPRPEDWPVLPVMWHSVSLVPDGFFDRNPALSAPAK